MKHIITFILLSLYLSTITTQMSNLAGNWIPGWQTDISSSCVPSEITIFQNLTSNLTQAAFIFPSNYTFNTNPYCYDNFKPITGNFTAELSLNGYESDSEGLLIIENYDWKNSESCITIIQSSVSSSLFSPLGPFIQVFIGRGGSCGYYIVPAGSSNPYQEISSSDFLYSPIMSVQGFNATSNQTVDSCCIPKSFSITQLILDPGNSHFSASFDSEITYSEESNIWCAGGGAANTGIEFLSKFYNGNISLWGSYLVDYKIITNNNSPRHIQVIYIGYSDSICTFNMTLSQTPAPYSILSNILQPNMTEDWITG